MARIHWLRTDHLDAPHKVTDEGKVIDLANTFWHRGWDVTKPSLIGYVHENRVQLLSGSHRLEAARLAGIGALPVILRKPDDVRRAYGDPDKWALIMDPYNFVDMELDYMYD